MNRSARSNAATWRVLAVVLALTLGLASLLAIAPAAKAEVGGGGVSGGGGSGSPANQMAVFIQDNWSNGAPIQGWGKESTDYAVSRLRNHPAQWVSNETFTSVINQACDEALISASQRGGFGSDISQSRVVSVAIAAGPSTGVDPSQVASYGAVKEWFQAGFTQYWNQTNVAGLPATQGWSGPSDTPGLNWREKLKLVMDDEIGANVRAICGAVNKNEPPASYDLSVTTQAQAIPEAGTSTPVYDFISTSNNGSTVSENVNASVSMNWGGFPDMGSVQHSVSKTKAVSNNTANQKSPEFTPADFGWDLWPAGSFWYNVTISKQGGMEKAVSHKGLENKTTEFYELAPILPSKELFAGDGQTPLTEDQVEAASMPFWAKVQAMGNGSTQVILTDTIASTDVTVGDNNQVTDDTIYVLGPDGNKVDSTITVTEGQVAGKDGETSEGIVVKAVVGQSSSADPKLEAGMYTLHVLTTPKPTGTDFDMFDYPEVCWMSPGADEVCMEGDGRETSKVTPDPNKAWTLDEEGALTTFDPDKTNHQGADQMTFLAGDTVSAVVNGTVHKNLSDSLWAYELGDDWTEAAKYVDFTNPGNAKMYVLWPGESKFTDVSTQFDFKTIDGEGGKYQTIGSAKQDSDFLARTKNLAGDAQTKLIISGTFRDDINTGGNTEVLYNDGWEMWNDEPIETNKPPVFVWTPDPNKDVLGSKDEDGDQESINNQMVFPGQTIQYEVLLDTHLPEGMAYDVTRFGMIDNYDPLFVPNKQSLTVTGRDGIIPASKYKVTWNDDDHSFELLFDQAWITSYLKFYDYEKPGTPNLDQEGRRYIAVNFDGKVSTEATPGQSIVNKAVQLINNSRTPTPEPVVTVPPTEPDKEDLKCSTNPESGAYENCDDIDGKTVVKGDYIDYRLTLDAKPSASKIAYRVHKLGMTDKYDKEYLNLDAKDVKVTVKSVGSDAEDKFAVGMDVTDRFNVQVDQETGMAYIFAKTIDTVLNTTGETIPGNPQPEDLAAYDQDPIDPLQDPGIDQDLLGNEYYIYLRTQVIKEANGYTIYNQATQNFENMHKVTKIVSNPLKTLKPEKDVTVEVGGESINHGEVPLKGSFNYLLKSSVIPADRAYETTQWSIVDDYDETADRYLGQYVVRAQTDIYDEQNLIAKSGSTIAVSDTMVCEASEGGVVGVPQPPLGVTSTGKLSVTESTEYKISGTGTPGNFIYVFEGDSDVAQTYVEEDGTWTVDYRIAREQGVKVRVEEKAEQKVDSKTLATVETTVEDTDTEESSGSGTDEDKECYNLSSLPFQDAFTVSDKDGVLTVESLKDNYFDTINTRLDLEQGWEIYVQFERTRPGEVKNIFTEYYNGTPREPEEVVTETPENPSISLIKYDIDSGIEKGDRNTMEEALKVTSDDVKIGFLGKNDGDVPLKNITLTDKTIAGSGTVKDIVCEPKLEGLTLEPGDTVLCVGTLKDLKVNDTHTNLGTITGESVYTGKKVTDEDPWNGRDGRGGNGNAVAKTGAGVSIALIAGLGLAGAGAFVISDRRKSATHAK